MSVVAADGHADAAAVLSFNNVGREEAAEELAVALRREDEAERAEGVRRQVVVPAAWEEHAPSASSAA